MKAFEFALEAGKIFDCSIGEPTAWTHNPPDKWGDPNELEITPPEQKHWYAVFGYQGGTEEQLVNALFEDFEAMLRMCESKPPTLLWRRMPSLYFDPLTFHTRFVIPELAFGEKRKAWLRIPSYKGEMHPYRTLPARQ